MNPIFRIELRRSNALALAALVVLFPVIFEIIFGVRDFWAGNWMKMAAILRSDLLLLAVVAVGAGALQAGLDHRRGVVELLASTPRSRRSRVLPVALAMAIAAAAAYLLAFAIASFFVAPYATYADPAAIAGVVGVGVVMMATSVWLGLLVGYLLPSRLTPPIASVVALLIMAVGSEGLGSLGNGAALSLLVPDLSPSGESTATVAVKVSALQGVWLLALGLSALGAFVTARRGIRVAAVLPAVLALVLVAPQLPHGRGYMAAYSIDHKAAELVCATGTPRVCTTRVDAGRLPQVTAPARAALTALARLPHPPTQVIEHPRMENTTFEPPAGTRDDTVWMDLTPYDTDTHGRMLAEDLKDLTATLLADAGVSGRCPDDDQLSGRYEASDISTAWLLGRPPEPDATTAAEDQERIRAGWTALTAVSPAEQVKRVSALRQARLTCQGDPYTILTKGSPR